MYYKAGARRAQAELGLPAKRNDDSQTSVPQQVVKTLKEHSPTAGQAGLGALALSPFLGMIGEKPIIHDPITNPNIPRATSPEDFISRAQPGDIIITGKDTYSPWKGIMSPLTGSELYHTQPVLGGAEDNIIRSPTAGEFATPEWKNTPSSEMIGSAQTLKETTEAYPDMSLLRPKKPMTPEQLTALQDNMLERAARPYDTGNAVKAWFNDVFVPKIDVLGSRKNNVICEGNVCSTLPAQSYKEIMDTDVVKGKPAKWVMPADFLRSDQFEPVAGLVQTDYKSRVPAGAKRVLSRAALGAGLAGTAYTAYETPEAFAVPAGAMAGSMIGSRKIPANLPEANVVDFMESYAAPEYYSPRRRTALRARWLRSKLRPTLLGAAAGTGAAVGLNQLRKHYSEK